VDAQVLDALVAHRNPQGLATAFYTMSESGAPRIEPLCAVYEPACLPVLQKARQSGRTGLSPLLESLHLQGHVRLLDLAGLLPHRVTALQSVNTPEAACNWSPP
jgi:molybdopterin-guanine dinucleotide biosynthesis protein A